MTRTKLIVVVCFCLALVAGGLVGYALGRRDPRHRSRESWIADELDLSVDQREKMKRIWSDVHQQMRTLGRSRRSEIRATRDQAIRNLLNEDQKADYDTIMADYDRAMKEMETRRRAVFDSAVEKTRAILTPEQREKYETLLRDRPPRRGRRGDDRRDNPPEKNDATPGADNQPKGD